MTAEPTYQYRVRNKHGRVVKARIRARRGAEMWRGFFDHHEPKDGPHAVQQRTITVTPWEDCDE